MASPKIFAGESFTLTESVSRVFLGLSWDALTKQVDLDASCVLFDHGGNLIDGVYFNQLVSDDGSITHTGDNKTGVGEGFDESIILDLRRTHPAVKAVVICITSYSGDTFASVETAEATFKDISDPSGASPTLLTMSLGCQGPYSALLVCRLVRSDANPNQWVLSALGQPHTGATAAGRVRTFMDILPQLVESLRGVIPDALLLERQKIPLKNFAMKKGQQIVVPPMLRKVSMGLGWDVNSSGGNIDLDSSVAIFDRRGKNIDSVYYGHKASNDRSVLHSGDNTTGAGEGDDEVIGIELTAASHETMTMILTVNVFTTGRTFQSVNRAYVRLFDPSNKFEMCRYTLSGLGSCNGLLLCKVFRDGDGWKIEAIGGEAAGRTVAELISSDAMKPFLEREKVQPPALICLNPNNLSLATSVSHDPDSCQLPGYSGPPQLEFTIPTGAHKLRIVPDNKSGAMSAVGHTAIGYPIYQKAKKPQKALKVSLTKINGACNAVCILASRDIGRISIINKKTGFILFDLINPQHTVDVGGNRDPVPVFRFERYVDTFKAIPMHGIESLPRAPSRIRIHVKQGRNLAAKDINGKSDPYCFVLPDWLPHSTTNEKKTHKTKTIKKTLNPTWNDSFEVPYVLPQRSVIFECFDYDFVGDDIIGSVTIPIDSTPPGDAWYTITHHDKPAGELQISLELVY